MNVVARTAQRVRSWFTGTPVLVTPNLTFVYQGRRKPQFLADNRATFDQLFAAANAALTKQYGAAARPVTREDMWLIVHCEAGLKGGFVDPDCKDHSLGERGLLPLPKKHHGLERSLCTSMEPADAVDDKSVPLRRLYRPDQKQA